MIALSDYSVPSMPTEHAIRRLWRLARLRLRLDSAEPVRARQRLRPATRQLLDEVAAPPACGPLIEELQAQATLWQSEAAQGGASLRVLVLPPCDPEDLLSTWATRHGHAILPPPPRAALLQPDLQIDAPALEGDGLLVVSQLERWFLRHQNGLTVVRGLIEALGRLERPCIVGCNSWAWAYLEQAAGGALVVAEKIGNFSASSAYR